MIHMIAYDLKEPNDTAGDYERVIGGIKLAYPTWCHLEKSVWLVETDLDASAVRDAMKKLIYETDILFVAKLSGNWASWNIGKVRSDWLQGRTF